MLEISILLSKFDIFLKNVKSAKYIGEIGLDYKIKNSNNRSCQRKVFSKFGPKNERSSSAS